MWVVARSDGFQAPQGTHDVLPPHSQRWQQLFDAFARACDLAAYRYVSTPIFEDLRVFQRMGEGTDVVRKEMYDFKDRSDPPHHLALRPEGTAGVVRAFNQHQPTRHNPQAPWKVWYGGPNFRYERPQKGRQRQFHQLGVEALGTADADIDVEVIALLWNFYAELGLRHVVLLINSMGTVEERQAYLPVLQDFLRSHQGDIDEADRDNIEAHPMRVLDSKRKATKAVVTNAPALADSMSAESTERFRRVQEGLGALGIPFVLEPRLVRGLDYYCHTTFEFLGDELDAAQSTIGAGGRYDGLVEELGGAPTPGIGFATGVERLLLACDAEKVFDPPPPAVDVFVIDTTGGDAALALTHELRSAGVAADRSFDGRAMRAQMKGADRSGASLALIVGDDEAAASEVTVRDLRDGGEQMRVTRPRVVEHVVARLGASEPAVSTGLGSNPASVGDRTEAATPPKVDVVHASDTQLAAVVRAALDEAQAEVAEAGKSLEAQGAVDDLRSSGRDQSTADDAAANPGSAARLHDASEALRKAQVDKVMERIRRETDTTNEDDEETP